MHFEWHAKMGIAPTLTTNSIKILTRGGFYIGGRDKFYRPIIIMDGGVIASLVKEDKALFETEAMGEVWFYLYNYVRKVMFVPGMVDTWLFLCDLDGLSMTKLPRKQLMEFGQMAQGNLMYFMHKSIYVNVSWGQRAFYQTVKVFIDPETRTKLVLAGDKCPKELSEMVHLSQLSP
jgi:hypothetical protein